MNGYNSNFFNKSMCESMRKSIQQIALGEDSSVNRRTSEAIRAQAQERNRQKKERQSELDALETQVQQTMRDMAASAKQQQGQVGPSFGNVQDPSDQKELRARALDQLQQNAEFRERANKAGQSVGQHTGSGSAGRFGYRYDTQKAADAAAAESAKRLFDAEGNARLPDFENKRWNANTGKWEIEMVGKGPSATATQKSADELAAVASGPNADIAAARAMGAAERGDVGFGRRVDPTRGTVDDTERYEQLKRQQQERQRQREQEMAAASRTPQRRPFNYVNPNSAEGRLRDQVMRGEEDPAIFTQKERERMGIEGKYDELYGPNGTVTRREREAARRRELQPEIDRLTMEIEQEERRQASEEEAKRRATAGGGIMGPGALSAAARAAMPAISPGGIPRRGRR